MTKTPPTYDELDAFFAELDARLANDESKEPTLIQIKVPVTDNVLGNKITIHAGCRGYIFVSHDGVIQAVSFPGVAHTFGVKREDMMIIEGGDA